MKTTIEIANLTKKKIDLDLVKKVVRKTVKLAGADLDCFDISIVFVSEAESRKINRKYRKKNKSTDVLSFLLDSGYNKNNGGGPPASLREQARLRSVAGAELVLCSNVIAKNARDNKVDFSRELAFILAHGVLHILGWRHGKKMFNLQDEVIQFF
jgi:probable rRNA maturation factor